MRDEGQPAVTHCPSCNAALVPGMRFCRMCGYRLGEGLEEYVATRRFDGVAPPLTAPAPDAAKTDPFAARQTWAPMAPVAPVAPLAGQEKGASRLSWLANCCNPSRMGWWTWVIMACVLMLVIGVGAKVSRELRGVPAGAVTRPAVAQNSLLAEADGFETADGGGALLEGLDGPDTSWERAGIIGGDIITAFDGKPVRDEDALRRAIGSTPPGKAVEVEFIRDGETGKVVLTTAAREAYKGIGVLDVRPGGRGVLGIDRSNLKRVRVPNSKIYGVEIGDVHRNGPADLAGMKDGDVVIKFGEKIVRTPGDLRLRIAEAAPGSTVVVTIMRGAEQLEIPVKIGRDRD